VSRQQETLYECDGLLSSGRVKNNGTKPLFLYARRAFFYIIKQELLQSTYISLCKKLGWDGDRVVEKEGKNKSI
jgi:hypothetical protein